MTVHPSTMTNAEIREIRENLGLSQSDMARRLDVSRAVLQRWEAGTTPISRRTAIAVRVLKENIFLAHAPEDYLELIEELKRQVASRKLSASQAFSMFEALGGHHHECYNCHQDYRCFCPEKLMGAGASLCPSCARKADEQLEKEVVEVG